MKLKTTVQNHTLKNLLHSAETALEGHLVKIKRLEYGFLGVSSILKTIILECHESCFFWLFQIRLHLEKWRSVPKSQKEI